MVKRRVMFTYPPELIREPIIHSLSQQFNIVTNIRLADITEDKGWVVLDMEGKEEDIDKALGWATSRGMRVNPSSEDTATEP